jgi:hypothetical protein
MAEMLLLAAMAMVLRGRVLQLIDAQTAWQSGDAAAMRRMRLIHCGAMLANVAILAAVASTVPLIL